MLTSTLDLEVLVHVLGRLPRLGDPEGWGASFGRELNATEDARHFVASSRRTAGLCPVVDGKHLDSFRLSGTPPARAISREAAAALLDARSTFDRARVAYRDVASATNRFTLIAARLPRGVVSTHTVFCLKTPLDDSDQYCLLALLNSLVANYLVRLQVTTHVTTALIARLPVPRPAADSDAYRTLISLARTLERDGLANISAYAELNALVARLYGLTPRLFEHIVGTFPLLAPDVRTACIRVHEEASETQRLREN